MFVEADLTDVVGSQHLQSFENKERKEDRAKARAEEHERQKHYTRPSRVEPQNTLPDFVSIISPVGLDDGPEVEVEAPPPTQREIAGAWGQRSFASALHSPAPPPGQRGARLGQGQGGRAQHDRERDWDFDAAWDDLDIVERRGKSRKKGGAKLVIIGGVGGRKR